MPTVVDQIRPQVRALHEYRLDLSPCRHKLDQNEVPWPFPSRLRRRSLKRLQSLDWARYPDFHSDNLRRSLARLHGWSPEGILVGNGSNELLALSIQAFGGPGRTVMSVEPTFSLYRTWITVSGAEPRFAIAADDLRLPIAELEGWIEETPRAAVVLCSPNNPTGEAISLGRLERLLERLEGPLLLDNAYGELADVDYRGLLRRFPQLILFRTFSKAWSMGGIRLGYMLADPELIGELIKLKLPYNVGVASQCIGEVVLSEPRVIERRVEVLIARRRQWAEMLEKHAFEVFPSQANYLLVRRPDARRVRLALEARGIRVRDVSGYPRLEHCVRISIGGGAALRAVDAALTEIDCERSSK